MPPDIEQLEAAYEQAWLAYNHIQRDLPQCEHVRAWQAQITAARKKHQAALREFDRAVSAAEPGPAVTEARPEPAPPSLPDVTSQQEPLFELEVA